jgi:antitoxin YefM
MQVTARAVSAFQAGHEGSIPFARSNQKPQLRRGATRLPDGHQEAVPFLRARRVPLPCHVGPAGSPRTDTARAVSRLTPAGLLVRLLTMTTLPLGEVKTHLSELVGRVHDHHERVTVTVHGRPSAVLVAVEDLERLEETLAIMRDADTMRRLAESDAELARGKEVTAAELAETIRHRSAHE